MTSDVECSEGELEIEDGHRNKALEKQEGTLPLRTASKETLLSPQNEESKEARDENAREPEDREPLYKPQKNFEEKQGKHGGARHVPGGAWHSQVLVQLGEHSDKGLLHGHRQYASVLCLLKVSKSLRSSPVEYI
ncbi:hypothetical protein NDU88_002653 [Pleurodeles waltl]|uniref:Uncharacterized protein n=1 Tax=Pleurodeles waltl TaxID=8319 RepID=A0AAV7LD35_PLEWA|nr:hypothetical protein NDU88_002653 [Pleurodeles waltl]